MNDGKKYCKIKRKQRLVEREHTYGILIAEIDPAYLSLFYLISRQIGNMLRMYQMSEEQKTMQRKLEILVREIQEKNEVLNFISESDALTGCMNRRGFIEKTLQMNRDHEGEELLILFADLDHTLLCDDKSISEKNRAAIQKMLERGHYFVLATGRPVESGRIVAKDLGLTSPGCYMIAFNGAVVYDCAADRVLHKSSLPNRGHAGDF